MKTASDYKTIAEIHGDAELNIVQRAHLLEAWRALHQSDPVPMPVPDAGQKIKLRQLLAALTGLQNEFAALDARQKTAADFVPAAQEQLAVLKHATNFDAPQDNIFALLIIERRLGIATEFLNNAPGTRELLTRRLIGEFCQLNHVLEHLDRPKHYVNGQAVLCIPPALIAIGALLQ